MLGGGQIEAAPEPLSDAEVRTAASAAMADLRQRDLAATGPIYFVHAEMLNDKSAGRRALVQHYRYAGDLTITSIVDLAGGNRVVDVRTAAHVPTPLSDEEFAAAREQAMQDPQVRAFTARREQVTLEPRIVRSTMREDPLYGHRVVEMFFRTPRGYLVHAPRVLVDLTAGRVTVTEQPPATAPHR
jgi:Cu2+-containing amine oxidase